MSNWETVGYPATSWPHSCSCSRNTNCSQGGQGDGDGGDVKTRQKVQPRGGFRGSLGLGIQAKHKASLAVNIVCRL